MGHGFSYQHVFEREAIKETFHWLMLQVQKNGGSSLQDLQYFITES